MSWRLTGWHRSGMLALIVLCCGLSSRWMLAEARPESASTLGSLAIGAALAGMFCAGLALHGKAPLPGPRACAYAALAGALMLGGPQARLFWHGRGVEPTDLVIALTLTPACFAVATSAFGCLPAGLPGKLWPALAAVAALLLILPEPSLADPGGDLLLLGTPVLTGVGAALFCAPQGEVEGRQWRAAFALLGAAVAFGLAMGWKAVAGVQGPGGLSPVALAADAPLLLLSVVVLIRLDGVRWTAQFTLVPLIVLAEGLWLARPGIDWRMVVGLALLVLGSLALVLPQEEEAGGTTLAFAGGSKSVRTD